MKSLKVYTLIELLVVVSVLVVLVVLLFSAMEVGRRNIRDKECLNNQKNLGLAVGLFCSDNQGRYPAQRAHPVGSNPFNHHSWDDVLGGYDGRNLSLADRDAANFWQDPENMDSEYVTKGLTYGNVDHSLYQCPSDIEPIHEYWRSKGRTILRRSYALNGNFSNSSGSSVYSGPVTYPWASNLNNLGTARMLLGISLNHISRRQSAIEDPSGSIALTEGYSKYNRLGRGNFDRSVYVKNLAKLFDRVEYRTGVHSRENSMSNYLLCDGSAKLLKAEETVGVDCSDIWTNAEYKLKGMWTTRAGD